MRFLSLLTVLFFALQTQAADLHLQWGYHQLDSKISFEKRKVGKLQGHVLSYVSQGQIRNLRALPESTYLELMKEIEALLKAAPRHAELNCTGNMVIEKKGRKPVNICTDTMSAESNRKIYDWIQKIERI